MTVCRRIAKAAKLVNKADAILGEATRMLNGHSPLAADHIRESQGQCLDALAHMENVTRKEVEKTFQKVLTTSGKAGRVCGVK